MKELKSRSANSCTLELMPDKHIMPCVRTFDPIRQYHHLHISTSNSLTHNTHISFSIAGLDPIVVPFDVAAAATDAQECKRVVDAVLQKTPVRNHALTYEGC